MRALDAILMAISPVDGAGLSGDGVSLQRSTRSISCKVSVLFRLRNARVISNPQRGANVTWSDLPRETPVEKFARLTDDDKGFEKIGDAVGAGTLEAGGQGFGG